VYDRGLLRIEAQVLPDGVLYRERALLRSIERKVRFEDIGEDVTRVFHVSRLYLLICLRAAEQPRSRPRDLLTWSPGEVRSHPDAHCIDIKRCSE
jgi:hypothetical protein